MAKVKKKYEKPRMINMEELAESLGDKCWSGPGADRCATGYSTARRCKAGIDAGHRCKSGTSAGVRCVSGTGPAS